MSTLPGGMLRGLCAGHNSNFSPRDPLGFRGDVIFPAADTVSRLPYLLICPDIVNSIWLPWVLVAETEQRSWVMPDGPQQCSGHAVHAGQAYLSPLRLWLMK